MIRFNQTERIGVNAVEADVIKEFDWIFREQAIVDVGIDALIETAQNGKPLGKFIGAQIKTGLGNFHKKGKSLVYYISQVHYEYWTNCSIPIILVAHIPDWGKTYWQLLSKKYIKRTPTRWKIEIPLKQEFNKTAKSSLSELPLEIKSPNLFISAQFSQDNDFFENLEISSVSFNGATEAVMKICILMEDLGKVLNEKADKTNLFAAQGLGYDSPSVRIHIQSIGAEINKFSSRLIPEITIFANDVTQAFFAHQAAFIELIDAEKANSDEIQSSFNTLKTVNENVNTAIEAIEVLRGKTKSLPSKFAALKIAKSNIQESLSSLIDEFKDAQKLCISVEKNGQESLKKYSP